MQDIGTHCLRRCFRSTPVEKHFSQLSEEQVGQIHNHVDGDIDDSNFNRLMDNELEATISKRKIVDKNEIN